MSDAEKLTQDMITEHKERWVKAERRAAAARKLYDATQMVKGLREALKMANAHDPQSKTYGAILSRIIQIEDERLKLLDKVQEQ